MPLEYQLIRSKRRTLALQVKTDATLLVRAPIRTSIDWIENFIAQKQSWIIKKQQQTKGYQPTKKEFTAGENFLYLGRNYQLNIQPEQKKPLLFNEDFYVSADILNNNAKKIFENWYKKSAKTIITERAVFYSQLFDLKFNKLRITSANSRWFEKIYPDFSTTQIVNKSY